MENNMEWIDHKIREKMQNLEHVPKAEIWNNIENSTALIKNIGIKQYIPLYSISLFSIIISSLLYFNKFSNNLHPTENINPFSSKMIINDSNALRMSHQNPFASYHSQKGDDNSKSNIREIGIEGNPALKNPIVINNSVVVPDEAIQQDLHPEEIRKIENQSFVIQKNTNQTETKTEKHKKSLEENDNSSFSKTSDKELSSQNSIQEEALLWDKYCLEINNFISPNADGINDLWIIALPDIYKPIRTVIFNSKGQKVFSSADYNNEFDGIFQGQLLPEGTYYYIIEAKNKRICKGALNIVR